MFWNIRSNLFRVYSCCFIFFMVDDLLDKLETRNEKWEMITCQYNLLFLTFLFVNNIIMSSQGNNINLLKQVPFYGKTTKSKIKKFTNAKLLLKNIF